MASSSSSRSEKIILQGSDGITFEVDEVVANQSATIKHMIQDSLASRGLILLPKVPGNILVKVMEYCKRVDFQYHARFFPRRGGKYAKGESLGFQLSIFFVDDMMILPVRTLYIFIKLLHLLVTIKDVIFCLLLFPYCLVIYPFTDISKTRVVQGVVHFAPGTVNQCTILITSRYLDTRAMTVQVLEYSEVNQHRTCGHPNVPGDILVKIIEYYKCMVTQPSFSENDVERKAFVSELVNDDEQTLLRLLVAADYLDIKGLLSFACENVSYMIKRKDPMHIRSLFNILLKFSLEEEERIRSANLWAFN
ncbi:hypothetical protein M9H77_35858 [Catharanthus roseus]|uniref:Uncharacterized protein n=1 Tax=Catharanthus roseus TaxID=4058 RepID=A0ACB9ZS33_CATRO|nr:hypothetical protein M9H77_35858 [Catharanthus roseus]